MVGNSAEEIHTTSVECRPCGGKRRWQSAGGKDADEEGREQGRKNKEGRTKFIGNTIETESARIDSIQICETQHFNY